MRDAHFVRIGVASAVYARHSSGRPRRGRPHEPLITHRRGHRRRHPSWPARRPRAGVRGPRADHRPLGGLTSTHRARGRRRAGWCPPTSSTSTSPRRRGASGKVRFIQHRTASSASRAPIGSATWTNGETGKTLRCRAATAATRTCSRRQRRRHPHHRRPSTRRRRSIWLRWHVPVPSTPARRGRAFLVDHNGTPTIPDDDEFLGPVGAIGLHGRFDTEDRDFCADIMEFLG